LLPKAIPVKKKSVAGMKKHKAVENHVDQS